MESAAALARQSFVILPVTDVLNRWVLFVNDTFIADDDATATSSSPTAQTGLYLLITSSSLRSLKGEHTHKK